MKYAYGSGSVGHVPMFALFFLLHVSPTIFTFEQFCSKRVPCQTLSKTCSARYYSLSVTCNFIFTNMLRSAGKNLFDRKFCRDCCISSLPPPPQKPIMQQHPATLPRSPSSPPLWERCACRCTRMCFKSRFWPRFRACLPTQPGTYKCIFMLSKTKQIEIDCWTTNS